MADAFFNTLGGQIKNVFEHPEQILSGVGTGIREIGGALNDVAKMSGNTLGGFVNTLGQTVGSVGGQVLGQLGGAVGGIFSELSMPLMIVGGGIVLVMLLKK